MSAIKAIYRRGVFEPLEPVHLHDEQKVHLHVEPAPDPSPLAWLAELQAAHQALLSRTGPLPDSTPDIAADQLR